MRSCTRGLIFTALLLGALPVFGMFEAFSQLAEEIRSIEQSADAGSTVQSLQTTSFQDVGDSDWFYRYVTPVARWGIVSGYKDASGNPTGSFGPGNTVTIAEFLKMSLEAANVDETACRGETQIGDGHWARQYVLCGVERDMRILESVQSLDRPAKRGEVLSILFDAFGDTVPPLFAPFRDTEGHPLESDIAYGAALKIVSGDKDADGNPTGTFRPDDPVKRAEAAKIIYERLRVQVMSKK